MARPERNTALKARPAYAPAQSGPLAWPNRTWFQWVVGVVAILAPSAALVLSLEYLDDSHLVPNVATGLLVLLNVFLVYRAMQLFDGEKTGSLRLTLGAFMKLFAILYAFGAMFLVAHTRENEWVLRNRWLIGSPVEVPDGVVWIIFGFSWFFSALCYLVGDAHIRISRRDAAEYACSHAPAVDSHSTP